MTVYGSAIGTVDESCELRADLGPYSLAHRSAEQVASASGAVLMRPAAEYGPTCEAWSGRIARLLRAHRLGDLGEMGDGRCNLIYLDDLVSAFGWALREPGIEGKAFNVADTNKVTWNDYFTRYAIALGAIPVRRIGPRRLQLESRIVAPPLKVLGLIANAARLRSLPIPPPIPPSMLRLYSQDIELSVGLLGRSMRPTWIPLDEGLRRAAEGYS
jgi:nucleoside-diphosphate-sugar epimerase